MILSFDLKYFSLFEVWVDNDVIRISVCLVSIFFALMPVPFL